MQLIVTGTSETNLRDFIIWLIEYIKEEVKKSYNLRKLEVRDAYLQQILPNYKWIQIIELALFNLIFRRHGNDYIIYISPNVSIYSSDVNLRGNYLLINLVKLLEYGNLDFEPYPLILPKFEEVAPNLKALYEQYKNEEEGSS